MTGTPTEFLHLFRFNTHAVYVPPRGQRLGEKYRKGAWSCVMCTIQLDWAVAWNQDHADDCPGLVGHA